MSASVAQYSKVYPDYFFKYRFTEEVHAVYGIISESEMYPLLMKKYEYSKDYGKRIHNLSTITYEFIDYEVISEVIKGQAFKLNVDIIIAPVDLSTFGRLKVLVASGIFDSTETIILSGAPKVSFSTSLSFLSMDFKAALCFSLLATLISFLISHNTWHDVITKQKLSSKYLIKAVFRNLKILWNIFSIFFYEPYPNKMHHISERILLAFWLIGVMFIGFLMSCFLKSKFLDENFVFVETIEDIQDLQNKKEMEPLMLKDWLVYNYLKNRAKREKSINDWLENDLKDENFCDAAELIDLDNYIPIVEGKRALVLNNQLMKFFFGYALTEDRERMKELKENTDGFYFSESYLKSDLQVLPINSSFVENKLFRDNQDMGMLVLFETKPYDYLDFGSKLAMDYVKWKKPMKTATNLTILDMAGVFYITLSGFAICCVVFLLELALGCGARRTSTIQ